MAKTNELSNLHCDKAQPRAKPYYLVDRGSLYLLIMPTGGKLWRWAYRYEGKQKQMAFGKYPDVPLARARALHAEARALLAAGTDPMALRKEQKIMERAAAAEKRLRLPAHEQPRFQQLYDREQERLRQLYASEKERLQKLQIIEKEKIAKSAFDHVMHYLLALGVTPQTIQKEIERRKVDENVR